MFHLDYLSCFLTILATILLARKSWIGLLVAIVNSLGVCAIGLRTSQLGFISANLFCICVYAFNMWPWRKEQNTHTSRSGQVMTVRNCVLQKGLLLSSPIRSITSPELNICNKGRTPEKHRAR